METPKHTPGPWNAQGPLGPGDWAVLSEKCTAGGNFYVASLPLGNHAEAEANAQLIAKAWTIPALLEACQHAARSEHHPACKCHGEYSGEPERHCTCHVQKARAAIALAEKEA